MSEPGAPATVTPPLVLVMKPEGALIDARFRLVSALVVAPASAFLVWSGTGIVSKGFGVVGLLVAAMWASGFRRVKKRAPAEKAALVLDETGLALESASGNERVAWSCVVDIDLDDDATTLLVVRSTGPSLRIEPGYGELDTIALHRVLTAYRHGAIAPTRG